MPQETIKLRVEKFLKQTGKALLVEYSPDNDGETEEIWIPLSVIEDWDTTIMHDDDKEFPEVIEVYEWWSEKNDLETNVED